MASLRLLWIEQYCNIALDGAFASLYSGPSMALLSLQRKMLLWLQDLKRDAHGSAAKVFFADVEP
jgi:hypothetical protein